MQLSDIVDVQMWQVDRAVGPNREGDAQFGDVQELELKSVVWIEDIWSEATQDH